MENVPKYKSAKFRCPHCKVYSQQAWLNSNKLCASILTLLKHIFLNYRNDISDYEQRAAQCFIDEVQEKFPELLPALMPESVAVATCSSCEKSSLWIDEEIVFPRALEVEPPNEDLNDEIKAIYIEATKVLQDSPKAAAALLRLALQKLLKQVGQNGDNINQDIKALGDLGLSPKIIKSLDLLRVVGNNAVHPGQIDLNEKPDVACKLFEILNLICEEMISKPKQIDALYNDIVPEETKKQIAARDAK